MEVALSARKRRIFHEIFFFSLVSLVVKNTISIKELSLYYMKYFFYSLFLLLLLPCSAQSVIEQRIGQLAPDGRTLFRNYPTALPSLLRHVREETTFNVVPEPVMLNDFSDERLKQCPFVYANFADRADWTFTEQEINSLRDYLSRGGFLYIDAGITASFLRERPEWGQHHSYAEWEASPKSVAHSGLFSRS